MISAKPLIFAHRGANKEAAENTCSAFDKALSHAIDGLETDVQLSRDEVAVLWHDRFLGKVSLPDKHIDDFDYAQLQAMNFAAHFSGGITQDNPSRHNVGLKPDLPISQRIMTLQDFLDAYRTRCRLLIEIKNRDWEPVARHEIKVRQTLNFIGSPDNDAIMLSSFNLASLIYAEQYSPGFPLIYNFETDQTIADAQRVLVEQPFLRGLCLPIENLDQNMVSLLRAHNKCIAVYTCNSDREINKALQSKVDILISDVPQKALQLRDA